MTQELSADTTVAETLAEDTAFAAEEMALASEAIALEQSNETPAEVTAPASEQAVKPAKRVKVKATPSSMVGNIKSACVLLSQVPALNKLLEYREFNAAGSFVVRLPRFADAVEVLPICEDSKHALQLLKSTRGVLESLTGTAKQTWVLHTSGSFAVYSKMSA